jgi:hypothetical protein
MFIYAFRVLEVRVAARLARAQVIVAKRTD